MEPNKLRIDLHMHSTVSDGTDAPADLLGKVQAAGIGLFSLTDHDAILGCAEIAALLGPDSPRFLPGVEFSCRDGQGKYHILGYCYDAEAASIRTLVEQGHSQRLRKLEARLTLLRQRFGICLPDAERESLSALPNPGKPHIANLLIRLGYAKTRDQAIRDYLSAPSPPDEYLTPERAIAGIRGAGGIPVLAHPCFGDGTQHVTGPALTERVERLLGFGLRGLEVWYPGFTGAMRAELLALTDRHGLLLTAGSDYHGSNKPIALGQTGLAETEERPAGLLRFIEEVGVSWT